MIAPIGFVSDHMEILFDLDTQARELCAELGLQHGASGDRGHASPVHTHDSRTDLRAHGRKSPAACVGGVGPTPRRLCRGLLSDAKAAGGDLILDFVEGPLRCLR